eukprot:gb/GEZJ01005564.1/.p1 GENE.gb/GEZJ01005564.1/~~gb/GEZJ01005564.1/.p1  ORF type:complete len:109 (-),score=3.89 gb/GEZJ01005564.1/:39-365(-)
MSCSGSTGQRTGDLSPKYQARSLLGKSLANSICSRNAHSSSHKCERPVRIPQSYRRSSLLPLRTIGLFVTRFHSNCLGTTFRQVLGASFFRQNSQGRNAISVQQLAKL